MAELDSKEWFDLSSSFDGAAVRAVLSANGGGKAPASPGAYRARLARELSLTSEHLAVPQQVHGTRMERARPGQIHAGTDGLFTDDPQVVLTLQVADCAPVFLYHPPSGTRGLVHAGWRGLAAGVLARAGGWLRSQGVDAGELQAAIGPAIERSCYEVGPEVVEHFSPEVWRTSAGGRFQLDLPAAASTQLASAGIPEANLHNAGVCTRCNPRCHSYRRDGKGAGRMVAFFYHQH